MRLESKDGSRRWLWRLVGLRSSYKLHQRLNLSCYRAFVITGIFFLCGAKVFAQSFQSLSFFRTEVAIKSSVVAPQVAKIIGVESGNIADMLRATKPATKEAAEVGAVGAL